MVDCFKVVIFLVLALVLVNNIICAFVIFLTEIVGLAKNNLALFQISCFEILY